MIQNAFIWRFPEIGVPSNHPFTDGIFPYKPSIWGIPIYGSLHLQKGWDNWSCVSCGQLANSIAIRDRAVHWLCTASKIGCSNSAVTWTWNARFCWLLRLQTDPNGMTYTDIQDLGQPVLADTRDTPSRIYTNSTAQGGGGSFRLGNLYMQRLVVVNHRWQSKSTDGLKGGWSCVFLECLQWLQWSPHPKLLDVVVVVQL